MSGRTAWWIGGVALFAIAGVLAVARPWQSTDPAEAVAKICDPEGAPQRIEPKLLEGEVAIVIDVCALMRREGRTDGLFVVTDADVLEGPVGLVESLELGKKFKGLNPYRSSDNRLWPQGDVRFVDMVFSRNVPKTGPGGVAFEQTPGVIDAQGTRMFRMSNQGRTEGTVYRSDFWVENGMDVRYLTVVVAEEAE